MSNENKITFNDDSLDQAIKNIEKTKVVTPPLMQSRTKNIVPVSQSVSMIAMIQQAAADPNTDVKKMETLWRMKQEIDAKEAETVFNLAMGVAQSQMTFVQNDCYNIGTKSRYASYKQLDKALRPIYTENGFALSFNIEPTTIPDLISVLCYVTHCDGHSRTYSIQIPNDGKGPQGKPVMTKTHATGSASAYGMRYLLKMIFNVAVGEEDDDGNSASAPITQQVKLISEDQQNTIHSLHVDNDLSLSIFYSWLDSVMPGSSGIESIPASEYSRVVKKIHASIAAKK